MGAGGTGNPRAVGEGSQLSYLAQGTGPGLQTVSSFCAKMLNPPPGEDELEGEGEPGEMRPGRRDGVSEGADLVNNRFMVVAVLYSLRLPSNHGRFCSSSSILAL